MNLYLFNDNDSAATYGIGTYLKELVKALENASIKIYIVHLHSICSEFNIEKNDQVEHWNIPEVRNENTFSGSTSKVEDYFLNVVYLLRIHIKETKDLVFHFNFNLCQLLAKELKLAFNCKTVMTVHFTRWMLDINSNLSMFRSIKLKAYDIRSGFEKSLINTYEYENLLYKEVDHVIALCQNMQKILITEYGIESSKIVVIPNGLQDIIHQKNENIKISLREKWHISESELLILFVGRLDLVKGLHFLIKAFHKVVKMVPNCRLLIAGNGDYDYYMKECEDIWTHVTWTGLLNKNKLHELYSIADIGVMPSFHEQCSYVAIEMMMHSVPLIVSTSTGLHEMVENEITGLNVPVTEHLDRMEIDIDVLAEKISLLLQDHTKRILIGRNARKRYERLYTLEVMRKNMLSYYFSLFNLKL